MKRQRLIWADSLKGWLIVLVILGHAIQNVLGAACETNHLWNLIYSFHMAAFMAVSGFVAFRPESNWEWPSVWRIIVRRFRQLIIPFIIWTLISQIIGGDISLSKFADYLWYPDKGLWFLWVLFFINVIFLLGCWLAERIKLNQDTVIIAICLSLVLTMVAFEVRVFGFQFVSYYFLFYALGFFLHKYQGSLCLSSNLLLFVLGVCWAILAWNWQMHDLPRFFRVLPLPTTLVQYSYRFITAAIAVYLLLVISPRILSSSRPWNRPFVRLGNLSLGIYVVHFLFLRLWSPMIHNIGMTVFCSAISIFLLTLTATWFIVWLLNSWTVTAKWLLGKI